MEILVAGHMEILVVVHMEILVVVHMEKQVVGLPEVADNYHYYFEPLEMLGFLCHVNDDDVLLLSFDCA